jgi:hypothetical protein
MPKVKVQIFIKFPKLTTYFEDKELDENAKTQLLTKKRNILVHYTKLFTYGLIPIIDIAGIFRFFTRVSSKSY